MPAGHMEHLRNFKNRTFCDRACRQNYHNRKTTLEEVVPYTQMARQLWDKDIQL